MTECDNCKRTMSDSETYQIHFNVCDKLKNIDIDTKKFYCPVCDRHFRLMNNLKKHQETRKHQDMLSWHKKQLQKKEEDNKNKQIEITKKQRESLNLKETQEFKYHDIETDQHSIDKLIDETTQLNDDFLNKVEQDSFIDSINQEISESTPNPFEPEIIHNDDSLDEDDNLPFYSNDISYSNLQEERDENDNFLDLLHQEDQTQEEEQPLPQHDQEDTFLNELMARREQELENDNLIEHQSLQIPSEDDNNDITSELANTQKELDADSLQREYELEEKHLEQDSILSMVHDQDRARTQNINANNQPTESIIYGDLNQTKVKAPEYPIQYRQHPAWFQMNRIIKERDSPKRLISVLIASPITYYPIIYAYIRYSDNLKGKKEKDLRFKLVSSLFELQKHVIKLIQAKQYYWGGKDTRQVLLVMSQWGLADYYRKLKK